MAVGIYDLGLTTAEFCAITPRMLGLLFDRHERRRNEDDRQFARITSLYAEVHRNPEKRPLPFTEEDWMLHPPAKPGAAVTSSAKPQTVEEQMFVLQWITDMRTMKGGVEPE